ncbi:MAG: hypothetical protein FRX49_06072 [Trebouxia sp. A1-2]|nr:MAG: hypothetical protein FRX49_06072 [Trebouxia sp. A1-2]
MALDIRGAVVPCPAPGPSSSPKSAEGAPERVLPAVGDGKLPAGHNLCQSPRNMCFPSMLSSGKPHEYLDYNQHLRGPCTNLDKM